MSVRPTKIGRRYGHFLIHSLLIADMQQASLDRWAWKSAARDLLGFRPEEVIGSFRPAATSGIFVEARRADIAAERQIRRAGCELMKPKPAHLGPKFGAQFGDRSVAENYKTRNPYPRALFDVLLQLSSGSPNPILDLGCGTGDIALEIASRSTKVVCGVDPSRAMLDVARTRAERENASNVRWFHESRGDVQI